ncbi:MAG: glycosyltransferase family 1 protein [Vicinamibacterales bacterium]
MKPLAVAVDARELAGHVTGVGVYLLNLLREWLPREDVRISLISHRHLSQDVSALPGVDRAHLIVRPDRTGGTLWEQLVLGGSASRSLADVLFAPAYSAPLVTSLPTVVAIHDVSFAAHPEWFKPLERVRRNFITPRSARRAKAVITISEFSAREIETRLGVPRARIRVIPPGAPARHGAPIPVGSRDPLVVFVGSIFDRRHVPDLISAFAMAARERADARLLIAGANRTWPQQDIPALIAASGAAPRITWLESPSNARIADALSRASAGAFLSEYEGFALTPFEALAHAVPSVMLDTPVAREVYGDAALYVRQGDIPGTAAALLRLLDDPAERAAIVNRAAPLWDRYDWGRAASDTLQVLREAAE